MNRIKRSTNFMAALMSLMMLVSACSGAETAVNVPEQAEEETGSAGVAGTEDGGVEAAGTENGGAEAAGTEEGTAVGMPEQMLTVTFLDVGQGNAVLVEQEGRYMLIDGGDREYSSFVVSYLENQGVEELAYVVSSHYDADHLNGLVGALHVFPCETVLAADYTTDSKVYESFCEVIEEKDVELVYPAMGDTYTFGDAEFTIVCPDSYGYTEDNDNSIGIRLVHGDNSFLICGDADAGMEQMMLESGLELDSDVYLASHHGSAGSSSPEFLQAVSPRAVVISAGKGNSYGHPTQRVLEDVQSVGVDLYRTDVQGTIVVNSDGSTLTWNVEPCEDYRSGEALAADTAGQSEGSDGNLPGQSGETAEAPENSEMADSGESGQEAIYIMNLNTKKFHLPSCSSAADINPENRAEFTGLREDLIGAGYEPCKRCNP